MTSSLLEFSFFRRPVLIVAEDLIGKNLVMGERRAMMTEVEAYDGPEDKACHAHKGKTDRTAPMFEPGGCWYVYLIYGMYWMLNIVTGDEDYPAAVLIRAVAGCDGPGKLTKGWGIDRRFNACPASRTTGLWIEESGFVIPKESIVRTPRIGVDYAGEWAEKPYRFVLKNKQ